MCQFEESSGHQVGIELTLLKSSGTFGLTPLSQGRQVSFGSFMISNI